MSLFYAVLAAEKCCIDRISQSPQRISKQVSIELKMAMRRALMRRSCSSASFRPILWRLLPLRVEYLGVLIADGNVIDLGLFVDVILVNFRLLGLFLEDNLPREAAVSLSAEKEKE
jgi:hypothetical protein